MAILSRSIGQGTRCPTQVLALASLFVPSGHVVFDQIAPVRVALAMRAPVRSAPVKSALASVMGQTPWGRPVRGAKEALKNKVGDCEELTSLFIALCRNQGVPARSVWVPGHCYPEFYLEDADGEGRWIVCQSAGARQFGTIDDARPILQRGDSFLPAGAKRPVRYIAGSYSAADAPVPPRIAFVTEKAS